MERSGLMILLLEFADGGDEARPVAEGFLLAHAVHLQELADVRGAADSHVQKGGVAEDEVGGHAYLARHFGADRLEVADQELDRIETLVQNLLKIAKFDAGAIIIEKRPENISGMMEDVKKHFAFRAAQEGKEIVLKGSKTLSFLCDRSWLVEAVNNIVKNALDHMGNGNHVRIEWGRSAFVVWIIIKDNGSGIRPEDLNHIFKRFYRSRYSKDSQGIGLGLPLAKSVVEAHGGTIQADSQPGDGTAFIMNFLIPTKL